MTRETLGKEIALDWYDGPLLTIRVVAFKDGDRLIQAETHLAMVGPLCQYNYANVHDVRIRFGRDDLLAMLAALDGKPVKDYRDEEVVSLPIETAVADKFSYLTDRAGHSTECALVLDPRADCDCGRLDP